ncbi:MAG: hypothetical protein AVDCRST_MAG36-772, partial [uncultured Nocardioidaceae bacterium]
DYCSLVDRRGARHRRHRDPRAGADADGSRLDHRRSARGPRRRQHLHEV